MPGTVARDEVGRLANVLDGTQDILKSDLLFFLGPS